MMSRILIIIATLCFSYSSASAQFTGGNRDGYDASLWTNPLSIYAGGDEDGYAEGEVESAVSIFAGSVEDGYDSHMYENTSSIYAGGDEDGYHFDSKIQSYIWTGAIGTNWNVNGNWLDAIIPNINSNVVIPSNATNFPVINIGLMSIGQDFNAGLYLCNRMSIGQGAELTFESNSFLENYGTLNIRGNLYFQNSGANALKNANGANLNIVSGGRLIME